MARFCLTPDTVKRFKKGLKDREIDPFKLADLDSSTRRIFLAQYVGEAAAPQVNALYESKLLLKNQKAGMISWAKSVSGMTPTVKRDIMSRIERMEEVLNPTEERQFMRDLAASRLGLEITEAEAKTISDLSQEIKKWKERAKDDGTFASNTDRLSYGVSKVNLEEYVNDLKLDSRKISFKAQPGAKIWSGIKGIPGAMKSAVASFDNSFWGRQGIKTLADPVTAHLWAKNFAKSFANGARVIRGKDAMALIRADVYSRPNSLNGKYKAGGYGLDVLSEEAFPSSFPERIPVLGRLFKASEVMYNGGALQLRADLADRFIKMAERNGVNTLDPKEAQALGRLVGSLTGRGSINMTPTQAKATNVLFFSIKFLKANFDTLTAGITDSKIRNNKFAREQAAYSLLRIIGTLSVIMMLAKLIDKDSVDEDPRSANFGKIKIFGHWRDITGGMGSLVTLAARLTPTLHDGEWGRWRKSSGGKWVNSRTKDFGVTDAFTATLEALIANKLSPFAGVLRDEIRGEFFGGEPFTWGGAAYRSTTPLSIQTGGNLLNDPSTSNLLGDIILEGLGFGANTTPQSNSKTKVIPEDKVIQSDSLYNTMRVYAKAMSTDPETAFNRIFSGQKLMQVSDGGIVVVNREQSIEEQRAFKRKYGDKAKEVKNDHKIPIKLGGSDTTENTWFVPNAQHRSYTQAENTLIKAVKEKKVGLKEAQRIMLKLKSYKYGSDEYKAARKAIIDKY